MPVLNPKITPLVDPYNPNPFAAEELVDPATAPPVAVPIAPPVPVGAAPFGILLGRRFDPRVNVVGFATVEADGT
jgi:hypothetical protein